MTAVAVAALGACGRTTESSSLERLPVPGSVSGATAGMAADAAPAIAQRGRLEYRVDGMLPSLAATAPAYRLGAVVDSGRVTTLARAFGLTGDLRTGTAASVIGDTTRQLRVEHTPGLPWSVGPSCAAVSIDGSAGGSTGSGGAGTSGGASSGSSGATTSTGAATPPPASGVPAGAPSTTTPTGGETSPPPTKPPAPSSPPPNPGPTVPPEDAPGGCAVASTGVVSSPGGTVTVPPRPADLPTKDEAQRIALDALRRGGLPVDGAVTVDDLQTRWMVRVDPVVDRLPTIGRTTTVTVGPKGAIETAFGFLAEPAKLGDYPLAGVDKGLDRLRNGTRIGPQPMIGAAEGTPATATGSNGGTPGVVPSPPDSTGGRQTTPTTAEPVIVVPVTGVHLALEATEGRLVPVYVFELGAPAGGQQGWSPSSIAVPAVVDRLLEQPTPTTPGDKVRGAPVPQPASRPAP